MTCSHRMTSCSESRSGMRALRTILATLVTAVLLLAASSHAAFAENPRLGDAKAAGLVGERPDGMLGLVTNNAPAEMRSLVNDINSQRKHEYERIAKKNGTDLEVVQTLAGQRLIAATPRRQFVMSADGFWVRK